MSTLGNRRVGPADGAPLHIAALDAIGGVPRKILLRPDEDAVLGEDADGLVIYDRSLVDLVRHYGFQPRGSRPYRAKTKGKVKQLFRYVREHVFSPLARSVTSTI